MTILRFSCFAFWIGTATVLLASCGQSQPPTGGVNSWPQAQTAQHTDHRSSWMLPEAKSENLLYVSDYGVGVLVYSYRPSRIKYVGLLASPQQAEGECVDKAQDIFVTAGPYGIFEYAHGATTPVRVLAAPDNEPQTCSVDPTTGDLATAGYPYENQPYGVAIYKGARGRPSFDSDPGFGDYECGYDDKGNLYIGGYVISGRLNFAELPKGRTAFKNVSLNQSFEAAGGIQWDGKHLAVGDLYAASIYEFDIHGNQGTEVGSTSLNGSGDVSQFYVDGNEVIVPSSFEEDPGSVGFYAYPAGGEPKKTRLAAYYPTGAAVSLAPANDR